MSKFLTRETLFGSDGIAYGAACTLGNGATVEINLDKVSPEMLRQLAAHGAKQKLGDATAGLSKDSDYEGAYDAMVQIRDAVYGGDFNRRLTTVGGIWVEAIFTAKYEAAKKAGKELPTLEEIREAWAALSEDQQAALKKHPAVKLAKVEIEKARLEARANSASEIDI